MAKELGARTSLYDRGPRTRRPAQAGRIPAGHGRTRLLLPPAHDAGHFTGNGNAAARPERPRASHSPIRIVPSRHRRRRHRRALGSAVFPRLQPDCFQLYSKTVERYGEKKLPEGHSMQDWGITYEELEPFYTRTERQVGVTGKAGNINGKKIEGGNIFEGWRSRRISPAAECRSLYFLAVPRRRKIAWISSVSQSHGDQQPALYESRRHLASGLRLLRILRAHGLHDRRQSAADQYSAAADAKTKKRFHSHRRSRAPHRL